MAPIASPEPAPLVSLEMGTDLVAVRDIAASVARFGSRYVERVFTPAEIAYCTSAPGPHDVAARFAARFAAKEATIKALRWADRGTDWRNIEVRRAADGWCEIALNGDAHRAALDDGFANFSMSMSHEHDYATAVVAVWRTARPLPHPDAR
jgi:holo-[acyl-carrier protein] synthase